MTSEQRSGDRPGLPGAAAALFRTTTGDIGLLLLSAVLFALAHPSLVTRWGVGPVAFVALAPLFLVLRRAGWLRVVLYGVLYGYASYALYNYWLATFHPLAIIIVPVVYMGYLLLLFLLLKLADQLFPRYGYLVQVLIWVGYEYVKSLGFLGYSYGILGYTQYLWTDFIQIAGVTGVWGVSLLVIAPSALLARWALEALEAGSAPWRRALLARVWVRHRIPLLCLALLLAANLVYGATARADYQAVRQWRVALIQQNIDPWRGGFYAYERSLDILLRLSDAALREDPDIVIWSETSFVPGIDWHTRHRTDSRRFTLVQRLRAYLDRQSVPFVVGNDDGQLERTADGEVRVDYNAAIMFHEGEIVQTYRKIHLVPFTESFPFKRQLPGIYHWLKEADTHFWKQGTEYVVFDSGAGSGRPGVRFSTPICFEDTFGYLGRKFVGEGAQVLVNMSNDSWSASVPAEMQHMMIGVFRAVENRRSVVRSTNGGMTVTVDPDGRLLQVLEPFTDAYLIGTVPVVDGHHTLYTRWGDWFGMAALIAGLALLAARGVQLAAHGRRPRR
jgi:apolipoprotein N-acyltransferase